MTFFPVLLDLQIQQNGETEVGLRLLIFIKESRKFSTQIQPLAGCPLIPRHHYYSSQLCSEVETVAQGEL